MSDPIGSVLTVPPSSLSGLSGISPVAFQLLTTGTATAVSSTVDSGSTIVQVSGTGQLLSAISSFRSDLAALQAAPEDNSPAGLQTRAQGLVDAFNGLQGSIGTLQTFFNALPGNLLVDQFTLTLNQLATTAIASGTASLADLEGIGITVQPAPTPDLAGTGVTVSVDESVLNAAATADPDGTAALLDQSTQTFLDQLAGFEAQAASAAISQGSLTQFGSTGSTTGEPVDLSTLLDDNTTSTLPGIGLPTDLLQLLNADSVLNDVPLTDLDLAAVGLDPGAILSTDDVRRSSLAATLSAVTGTPGTPGTIDAAALAAILAGTTPATDLAGTANALTGLASPAPPLVATGETAAVTAQAAAATTTPTATPATTTAAATPTVALSTADAVAAERRTSAATQALQNLLLDPRTRAVNNLFDPAYSALIAASHLSDFVQPLPATNPQLRPADTPAEVAPAAMVQAIAEYNEASRAGTDYRELMRAG